MGRQEIVVGIPRGFNIMKRGIKVTHDDHIIELQEGDKSTTKFAVRTDRIFTIEKPQKVRRFLDSQRRQVPRTRLKRIQDEELLPPLVKGIEIIGWI